MKTPFQEDQEMLRKLHAEVRELKAANSSLLAACKEYIAYRAGNDGNIDEIAARMKSTIARAEGKEIP